MNSITFISGWTPPSIIEIIGLLFLAHYLIYVPLSFLFGYLGSTIFSKAGRILKPKLGDWAVVRLALFLFAKNTQKTFYNLGNRCF